MATNKPMVTIPSFNDDKKYELIQIVGVTAQVMEKGGSWFTIHVDEIKADNKPAENMIGVIKAGNKPKEKMIGVDAE